MYQDFCDVFVLDASDAALRPQIEALGLRVVITDTVMQTLADKQRLARDVLRIVTSDKLQVTRGEPPVKSSASFRLLLAIFSCHLSLVTGQVSAPA